MEMKSHTWWSPSLGRDMKMNIYGDSGTPILALPGNAGNVTDWETYGLIDSISYQIVEGLNQVFCVEAVDDESFLNQDVDPKVRLMRQRQYESFLADEVIPHIKDRTAKTFIIAAGIHLGGLQVLNLVLKYPHKIDKAIMMDGDFDIKPYLDDFYDTNVYFFNPADYLTNMNDNSILKDVRATDIRLVTGEFSEVRGLSEYISQNLWHKGVQHALDIWPEGTGDNWENWGDMLKRHVP